MNKGGFVYKVVVFFVVVVWDLFCCCCSCMYCFLGFNRVIFVFFFTSLHNFPFYSESFFIISFCLLRGIRFFDFLVHVFACLLVFLLVFFSESESPSLAPGHMLVYFFFQTFLYKYIFLRFDFESLIPLSGFMGVPKEISNKIKDGLGKENIFIRILDEE